MKKIILITGLFFATTSFAQEHSWFVGGNIAANISSTNVPNGIPWTANWTLSPEIGKYVSHNFQLGGNLSVGERLTRYSGSTSRSLQIGAGIFGRYLFGEKDYRPFVGLKIGYSTGSNSWSDFSQAQSSSFAMVNAGALYNINSRFTAFGSVGTLGYTSTRLNSGSADPVITRSLGFDLSSLGSRFVFGLYYNFGKTQE